MVDTDATASKVLDVMLKEKTGRVTFMPLNRLKPKSPPAPDAADAIPILSKLEFKDTHAKALQQVFGKTCVCQNLAVAASYVKSHGINTITLDGDKVDRKGALTGGFHDIRRSRIDAIKGVATWREKYDEEKAKSTATKAGILDLDQRITKIGGEIAVLTGQQNQIRDSRERLLQDGAALTRERERIVERIARLRLDKEELEGELKGLEAKLAGYEAELRTPLTEGLTEEEEELIETLGKEVERRQRAIVELAKKKNSVRIPL